MGRILKVAVVKTQHLHPVTAEKEHHFVFIVVKSDLVLVSLPHCSIILGNICLSWRGGQTSSIQMEKRQSCY